jgi:ATP-dependent DNA helicase RecG
MDMEIIQNLIADGQESMILEFKKSTAQLKGAGKTLCAFLNGCGGVVLIGITDQGKIVGQEVTDSTKRLIGNTLTHIIPDANIKVSYVDVGNRKKVIVLEADPDFTLQPYTFDAKSYVRLKSTTKVMPRDKYHRISFNNMQQNRSWETGTIEDATINDLDTEEILRTVSEGIANKRIPAGQDTDKPEIALKKFGLLKNGHLTNAAMVLFGKETSYWLPQCAIRLARFRGNDKSEFIDSKVVEGNAFQIIDGAMAFADLYLPVSSRFDSGTIERIDEPLFPVKAIREVFANAVGHREYSMNTATLSFGVYNNRLEVWSPGLPPDGVTFDNIKTIHESIPRNKLITRVLYYRKIFESWGRGVEKVVSLCKKAGHPEPEFVERTGGVCVILKSKQSIGAPVIIEQEATSAELNSVEQEILQILENHETMKVTEIVKQLQNKVADRTVRKYLIHLNSLGLVIKTGEGKKRRWQKAKK